MDEHREHQLAETEQNKAKDAAGPISTGLIHIVFWCWSLVNRILYRPHVTYDSAEVKKLMKDKPCILIANHTRHADGYVVPPVLKGRKIYVLITAKWYNKKKLNWIFRRLRYIPIDLTVMDNSWMEKAKQKMEEGYSILIFPEGKLSRDGNVDRFLPGFLMLARHTDAQIVPITIRGGYRAFHRQDIRVGNPIAYDAKQKGRPSQIFKTGAELCRNRIIEMLAEDGVYRTNPGTEDRT